MKKFLEKGFSLSEILIALAIISVIATMGFSIAQKGIANAYQGYYYTGYLGMNTALNIAYKEIYVDDYKDKEIYQAQDKIQGNFLMHVKTSLSLKKDDCKSEDLNSIDCQYIAPNGIKYHLSQDRDINKVDCRKNPGIINIIMYVPSVKTKEVNQTYRKVGLTYNYEEEFLKPWVGRNPEAQSLTDDDYKDGWISLHDRIDLLAFSYHNGCSQYTLKDITNPETPDDHDFEIVENNCSPPQYASYKDAMGMSEFYIIKLVNPKYAYINK